MVRPLTTKQFIAKARKLHGNQYDYSKVIYKSGKKKVCIICHVHGEFMQSPADHINRTRPNGCPPCGRESSIENQRKTKDQFILQAKAVHGDKYQYDLVKYVNGQTNVKITCPKHGIFEQQPNNHITNKQGCPRCSNRSKRTTEEFIEDATKVHGDKYDYTLSEYVNLETKVKIICKKHGEFSQRASDHLDGSGCRKCRDDAVGDARRSNTDEFIEKAKKIHGNTYDYSLVDYKTCQVGVTIICKKHKEFVQRPTVHLGGSGCPICKASKGEKAIRQLFEKNSISYVYQKKFNDCRDAKHLLFDFYVANLNLLIEFDGKQHDEVVSIFGGDEGLADRIRKDQIKNNYAKSNSVGLIRINDINKIEETLNPWINIYKALEEHLHLQPITYIYYNETLIINDLDW